MDINELFESKYSSFKMEGVVDYIDDLIEEEVCDRTFNSIQELYVFLDILAIRIQAIAAERIGIKKINNKF